MTVVKTVRWGDFTLAEELLGHLDPVEMDGAYGATTHDYLILAAFGAFREVQDLDMANTRSSLYVEEQSSF